jgi:hypothetical protein
MVTCGIPRSSTASPFVPKAHTPFGWAAMTPAKTIEGRQHMLRRALARHQVMVRADLQSRLTECHRKIQEHHNKVNDYHGWVCVLEANQQTLNLNADDYLFFFGE